MKRKVDYIEHKFDIVRTLIIKIKINWNHLVAA